VVSQLNEIVMNHSCNPDKNVDIFLFYLYILISHIIHTK